MNCGFTLSQGSTGADVKRLQRLFVMMKTASVDAIDGVFGPKTEAAVKACQAQQGLTGDGIVGDRTWWTPTGAAGATLESLSELTTV
jgi:peptidoglycan hydrolase-like protein with peptidoglycan-binding domain